jgi:pre-peptidase
VNTTGGTGDVELYVREGVAPTTTSAVDCASEGIGNSESCPIATPEAGDWYILLNAFAAFSGVTLSVTVTP